MRVSEEEFNRPDDKNPRYSLAEVDFYGHIPYKCLKQGEGNHRLSLRKDLTTGKYQIYAHYWRTIRSGEYEEVFYENTDIKAAFRYAVSVASNKWDDYELTLELEPLHFGFAKPTIRHGVVGVSS